jgi:hypothetical protein
LATIAAQTEPGAQRLASRNVDSSKATTTGRPPLPTALQLTTQSFDAEAELRRLSEAVRVLNVDRDGLLARINTLERDLDDVTGSIARGNAGALSPPLPDAAALPPSPDPKAAHAALPSPSSPPSVRAANMPVIMAGTLPAAEAVLDQTGFGVDLGGAPTMDGVRTLWSVVRTNYPRYVEGMRPVVALRETNPGAVELRLIIGPLVNAGAAARLCATLVTVGLNCQAAIFEGQRLALR